MVCAHGFFAYFWRFFVLFFFVQILPQLKNFSRNLSVHIIYAIDTTFVPNLTFLGLLSPEILLGEKKVTQSPSLFRDP